MGYMMSVGGAQSEVGRWKLNSMNDWSVRVVRRVSSVQPGPKLNMSVSP